MWAQTHKVSQTPKRFFHIFLNASKIYLPPSFQLCLEVAYINGLQPLKIIAPVLICTNICYGKGLMVKYSQPCTSTLILVQLQPTYSYLGQSDFHQKIGLCHFPEWTVFACILYILQAQFEITVSKVLLRSGLMKIRHFDEDKRDISENNRPSVTFSEV